MSEPSDSDRALRGGVRRGIAWVGLASSLVGVLDIIATALIVALWVPKEEIGVAVPAFTLFRVFDLATDLGLSAAVVQHDDHSPEKISTVFWLNLLMSGLLGLLLVFGVGPILAAFHGAPILAALVGTYSIKLIWQNVYFMPAALMRRELRFKELSIIRVLANVAEFAGKVGFAAAGFGVWCFVAGPLCRVAVTGVGIQMRHPWRPRLAFRLREARGWVVFGLRSSAHKILFHVYSNLDYQVVGRYFDDAATGLYYMAFKIVLEPALVLSEIIINVAFPAFARLKHHAERLFEQLVEFARMNLVVMLAFVGVVFVGAEEILALISEPGNDYTAGAPMVRVLCAVAILRALSFILPPLLDGVGKPQLTLRYQLVAAVLLPALFVGFALGFGPALGPMSVALAWALGYPVAFAVLVAMSVAVLEVSAWALFRRLTGILGCALVAVPAAVAAKYLAAGAPAALRFGIATAVMLGLFAALLARFEGIRPSTVRAALKS